MLRFLFAYRLLLLFYQRSSVFTALLVVLVKGISQSPKACLCPAWPPAAVPGELVKTGPIRQSQMSILYSVGNHLLFYRQL